MQPSEAESVIEPMLALYDGIDVSLISVEDYVMGCVMHEMPYDFELQAKMAQAVAARTYLYYCLENGYFNHPMGDVCTDVSHCMGYITKEAYAERYGEAYAELAYSSAAKAAALTCGEVQLYGKKPLLAVWHSSSYLYTEDSGEVWLSSLPYLVSVTTEEDAVVTKVTLPLRKAVGIIKAAGYDVDSLKDLRTVRNESGRCVYLYVGGEKLGGDELRRMFSLKSTNFTASVSDGELVFTVYGYGHGVGLSQYGAQKMAADGKSYKEILAHYYRHSETAVYR